MENESLYDVTVIGGGPIGLFTTFYSGLRELKTKLIESSPKLGGKITMFYPEKVLRDIGGISGISGADLVKQLEQQAMTFEPTIVRGQLISGLKRLEDGTFLLTSTTGEIHHTRTIILTVGAGIFKPVKLDIIGAERYENSNLHYWIEDLNHFKNKRVFISGGGNTAVDWANELYSITKSITVIHRKDEFTGHEQHVAKMKEIADVLTPYRIIDLHGDKYRIKHVTIEHMETGELLELEMDELIVNHGIRGDYGGILNWGLEMHEERFVVNSAMETHIPGIFAAGDAVTYPNKLKLIAGGFAEGPIALNSAQKYIKPDSQSMAMYSTHHEKLLEKNKN